MTDWNACLDDCVAFAQRLIRTPSMPGEEAAIAAVVAAELKRLGYDDVWSDAAGNVFGRLHGRDRSLPALVLNTHLDHVDPGDPALWPTPPFAAEIRDGRLIGRGACDIKGPMAVQVHSAAVLLAAGERPRRDVVFCGDTLFGAGCGYLFDGPPAAMHASAFSTWIWFGVAMITPSGVPSGPGSANRVASAWLSNSSRGPPSVR